MGDFVKVNQRMLAVRLWHERVRDLGPLIPAGVARKLIGCSKTRFHNLAVEGRIRVIRDLPGLSERVAVVPLEDLLAAPLPGLRGRKGLFGLSRKDFFLTQKPRPRGRKSSKPQELRP